MFNATTTMLIRDCRGTPHLPNSRVIIMGDVKQAAFSTERIRVKFEDNGETTFVSPDELNLAEV